MSNASFSVIPGLAAVSISSGFVLTTLCLINRSGLGISLWLGLIAAVVVALPLALLGLVMYMVPSIAAFAILVSRNLVFSILLWTAIAIAVLFIANAITTPQRVGDVGFWVETGLLYGGCGGLAYWFVTRVWSI